MTENAQHMTSNPVFCSYNSKREAGDGPALRANSLVPVDYTTPFLKLTPTIEIRHPDLCPPRYMRLCATKEGDPVVSAALSRYRGALLKSRPGHMDWWQYYTGVVGSSSIER